MLCLIVDVQFGKLCSFVQLSNVALLPPENAFTINAKLNSFYCLLQEGDRCLHLKDANINVTFPMSFANNFQVLEKRGYQTFELINYGVQGHVYKACKGGRDYTIKVVSLFANENQTAKNKKMESDLCIDVKRELNILTKLRHPSCLRVEECFQTRTKVYIVMPFLVGGTLGSAIKERSLLCEWNVKIWFPPIVCSLRYLLCEINTN